MNLSILLQTPVPRDIPLDMPLPKPVLVVLIIVSFLLHILFVNLMLGGTLLTFWYELKGLKNKAYMDLSHEIGRSITVNKSMAVVLGVAPLLTVNALYTIYFYTANALTGLLWISVVPLVTIAFLLTYAHRYTWKKLENNRIIHLSIIGFSVLLFLFIPLIFLANINLMLFPDEWSAIRGFFSALMLPNVWPRYLHFITASMAVTGLFLFWMFGRKQLLFEERVPYISRANARRKMYTLALVATLMQLVFGPFLLFTLPSRGLDWIMVLVILAGVTLAIFAMVWMWKAITGPEEHLNKNFYKVVLILGATVIFMGTGRQIYRANALAEHQHLLDQHKIQHQRLVQQARENAMKPQVETIQVSAGEQLFQMNCKVCHNMNTRLVGPPVAEMIDIYENNQKAMKEWIKDPGRKRMDYPPMTGFPNLTDPQLTQLTDFVLGLDI